MSPRVSLAMPVYNGERFISVALESLLNQTFTDFELIITDNASTDGTEASCRDFAQRDGRINYIRNKSNLGAAANFNLGYRRSQGTYFKWCAHDDFLSHDYLEQCVKVLDATPNAVVAYGRLKGVDSTGAPTGYTERHIPDLDVGSPPLRFRKLLAAHGLDAAMFGLFRGQVLAETSLHAPYYGSDCALLAELALLGGFRFVPGITLYSREHPTRSVNLHRLQRQAWQNPGAANRNPFELTNRIRHLFQIVRRHSEAVPLHRTLPQLSAWALHPLLIGRCMLEVIGELSPALRTRLRAAALRILRGLFPDASQSPRNGRKGASG